MIGYFFQLLMRNLKKVGFAGLFMLALPAFFFVVPAVSSESKISDNRQSSTFDRQFFGLHIHRAENERHWPTVFFGSWRLWDAYVTWARLQPTRGEWDFSRLDPYVDKAGRAGIELLMPLGMTPAWASARPAESSAYGPGQAAEPASLDDWRLYVRTVATRYRGRIYVYELWNEVTEKMFWTGRTERMVELACAAKSELSAVDPSIRLVAPSGTGIDRRLDWIMAFLDAGGAACVDVLSYHLYHGANPPEQMVSALVKLKKTLQDAGYGELPIWNTESGYWFKDTVDKTGQAWTGDERKYAMDDRTVAAYMPRVVLLERALGFERHYWYAWDNQKMGLLDVKSMSLRLTGEVYGRLSSTLLRSRLHECGKSRDDVWTCRLTMANGRTAKAIWSPGAQGEQRLVTLERDATVSRFDSDETVNMAAGERLPVDENVRLLVFNP